MKQSPSSQRHPFLIRLGQLWLAALVLFPACMVLAQSGASGNGSYPQQTEFQRLFDREWRKTDVHLKYLKALASDYSIDAAGVRDRVTAYLDKAKGNSDVPPFKITTTGYVPETTAYDYLDEAKDWGEFFFPLNR